MRTLTDTLETQSEELGRISGNLDALVWELEEALRQVRGGHMAEAELEPLVTRARAVLADIQPALPPLNRREQAMTIAPTWRADLSLAPVYNGHRYMK